MTKRTRLNLFLSSALILLLFLGCTKEKDQIDTNSGDPQENTLQIKPTDFLSESKYNKLVIEITSVQGYEPVSQSVAKLKTFLESILNKSGGISVVSYSIPSPGKTSYTLEEIKKIEEENRTRFPEEKTLTAWFFFADADYAANEENSKVLGVAYSPTSMAIFEKTINEFSGGFGQPSGTSLEQTVTEHEFGHILGLVNNGTDMTEDHQDTLHGKHCNNENCLMYYAAEHSSGIISFLSGGSVPTLDTNCLEDLKNNGGK